MKGEEKNGGKWKIGIVGRLIIGRDGIVRDGELQVGAEHTLEWAIQHLYPLELSCDTVKKTPESRSNATEPKADVPDF